MPRPLPLPGYLGDGNLMILNLSHYGKFWVENFVFDIGAIGGT
ncbi:phosphoric diester hydrolase [Cylindrospermopsis raciborskii MVCC19]|uniref:Phosphoric diester hydrolase n=1 Tax=Cylindrospermopsis raciborskii CENA302 TaxID=1170768 RepID=A0A9Q5W7Y5_9CYAN|nr:phosphoric diester hydrolase [Cylindrospermopsis raciborskii MVCC19]OHY33843.1 phosphoric diester hydrolase [Cylindrospermopsis raciborskii MVCC14]OPH08894.1 phosphoric diester hydrolase [Cylindrospermopsis raciborskii CENA302]